jgi:hypothetical protein
MHPVHRGSNEFKRRQADFTDELFARFQVSQSAVLFGAVPHELHLLLEAGLEELPFNEREAFVKAVQEAQAVLRDQCTKAAFASGRAQYLCPPNAAELIDYRTHRILIKPEGTL